ncbi:hypothetical protein A8C32_10340 [Flavivirga aquatica]|uniref:RHS repeat-associated core domain-containing protein n=2 Tax=Flavivirga aquatica TaxID=1849968 RepID=A0A1E5TCM9_9FLAO|nr:hypothetical protein A8C32_10340 [Flavivirga aquatica]
MDNEIKGEGNSANFTFRMHDPRLNRFFTVDPLTQKYPHYSPYSFSGNKLINSRELEGLEEMLAIDKVGNNQSAWFYVDRREMGHFGGIFSSSFGGENSFVKASIYNTEKLKSSLYRTISERHSYYNFVHLYMKEKGISNQWFKAAAEVTKYNPFALEVGVGAAAKSATNMWFLSDSSEEFLRGGNEFLFSHNMNNAKRIIENEGVINDSFADANGVEQSFFGLAGADLDLKLVEYEQTLVQTYMNNFKKNNPKADMANIVGQINSSFSNPLAPNSVSKVIREFFTEKDKNGNETINFDFSNYEHRVKLGQEIIKDLYEEED